MSNPLSVNLLAQMYGQVSDDPFLMLVTVSHASFDTIYLVNNTVDQVSRGNTFRAFPMQIRLPSDDGETAREVAIEFDNVSLELIDELRTVTDPMDVKIEMVLASALDDVELSLEDLKMDSINYDSQKISARLYTDDFLNTAMTSEKYTPELYGGLF